MTHVASNTNWPKWYDGWQYRHRGTLGASLLVDSSLQDITSIIATLPVDVQVSGQPVFYDAANDVFKVTPGVARFYGFFIACTFTGSFANNASQSSYEMSLYRPDMTTKIRGFVLDRPSGLSLNFDFDEFFVMETFVFDSGVDPYQTDGFKITIQKLAGADMTLSGEQEFRFFS